MLSNPPETVPKGIARSGFPPKRSGTRSVTSMANQIAPEDTVPVAVVKLSASGLNTPAPTLIVIEALIPAGGVTSKSFGPNNVL